MDRLAFQLPSFTRLAWVSDEARHVWEPRLRRIKAAWSDVAWMSVAAGLRRCAILYLNPDQVAAKIPLWAEHGLGVLPWQTEPTRKPALRVAVGHPATTLRMQRCRDANDHQGIGRLLGYPGCCRAFFERVWVAERHIDATWPMALAGANAHSERLITLQGPLQCNILHRWIGVRAVHHLPCRFDCPATLRLGRRLLAFARNHGFKEEAVWIEEVLSWPVEWSALHGIAEIRSPVLKIVTETDATPRKLTVQWRGAGYPREGATGLRFPYRPPQKPLPATTAPISRAVKPESQDWFHSDNGFRSLRTMVAAHEPILALGRATLDGRHGAVIDAGCGNGALLRSLCTGQPGLVPYGLDRNAQAIEHARLLHGAVADNFVCADMFDAAEWLQQRRFELALLMPGRLLEAPRDLAQHLIAVLRAASRRVLVYVYPGYRMSLAELVERMGLDLELAHESVGLLRTTQSTPSAGAEVATGGVTARKPR